MGVSGTANMSIFKSNPGAGAASFLFQNGTGQTRGTDTVEVVHNAQAQDGSDTDRALYVNLTNADHTGATNFVYGIDITGITADAQAEEYAINIGSGWDEALRFERNRVEFAENAAIIVNATNSVDYLWRNADVTNMTFDDLGTAYMECITHFSYPRNYCGGCCGCYDNHSSRRARNIDFCMCERQRNFH
jgi:hypothetical protein